MNRIPALLAGCTALFVAALLGGCSLGGAVKSEEYATYALEFELRPASGEPLPWQLAVEQPVAPDALAGTRIATRESDGSYGVLKGVRWSERAPELVQSALVRTFEDSGRLRGVARSSSALRSDFVLLTELRAFESDYRKGGPEARVVLSAKLARSGPRDVLAARLFEQAVPAQGTGVHAVATAFGKAIEQLMPELRDWVLEAGTRAPASEPEPKPVPDARTER
jgi:cholesterol transport system auxiliary component